MGILVNEIRLPLDEPERQAVREALRRLGLRRDDTAAARVVRRAVDARRKDRITLVYSVLVELPEGEGAITARSGTPDVRLLEKQPYSPVIGTGKLSRPPVIAGFGPAGMLAGLLLAQNGYRPVILERGARVDVRTERVERFFKSGELDPRSNVQFGEGGAGTFSDGKLTTRIGDPRCEVVLRAFVEAGAPDRILTDAKPHIGTDVLRRVVASLREKILSLGGSVLFESELTDIAVQNGSLTSVRVNHEYDIETSALILAVGHSARDTRERLLSRGLVMEPKPFSVGVRIEHLQSEIDAALYGSFAGHPALRAAEYQLSHREGERGVYTFCMCPGGSVVAAASEAGGVVTNGMSLSARDGVNANSALVVSVGPEDYGRGPLDGQEFQRKLERAAFLSGGGGYLAPCSLAGDFLEGRTSSRFGRVKPTYEPGTAFADLSALLPSGVTKMLKTGLSRFERKLPGFGATDALLTGVETRTSSPVRMPRDGELMAPGLRGLYPCGEGAGWAGGIMSAGVDGLRVAEKSMEAYAPLG